MKRLLFFPGHRLLAYEWERGRFKRTEAFEPDDNGRAAFRAWLEEEPSQPVQLLLDVIEEEFHVDRVPHVIGRDHAELFERTARRHFRSTEFRYIVNQGREVGGRRDDKVLIAGLTNPELLRTWLSVIDDASVPLRGIYSLPLISEALLPYLGAGKAKRALVISQQIPSTLRQSYFENGRLRFSRLVPGRYSDARGFADFFQRELRQTLRFLETQRFRSRGSHIDVYVLVSADIYHVMREELSSSDAVTCHLVPLERLAKRIGMRGSRVGAFSDTIFGHLLLRQWRPSNHYGFNRLRRHFFAQRARAGLAAAGVVLLVAAVAYSIGVVLRAQVYADSIAVAEQRADEFDRRYRLRLQQLDQFDYRAQDVKQAVDLLGSLRDARLVEPGSALATLGNVLVEHPAIIVNGINWRQTDRPDVPPPAEQNPGLAGSGTGLVERLSGPNVSRYRYLLVYGDVVGFEGEYRRAVELFDGFVASLREQPGVTRVDVMVSPFALESDTGVSGDSGLDAADESRKSGSYRLFMRLGGEP
jgi:hypothetical protein